MVILKWIKRVLIAIWSIMSIILLSICFMLLYGMTVEIIKKIISYL